MNPDRLAELEEELRFLLRSIEDLDREHAAGDVDEQDYPILRDGYTARAATVMRSIDQGRAALPVGGRASKRSIAIGIVVVILVAAGSGWFVASQSGQRLTGQPMTGGAPVDEVASKLAQARSLLGTDQLQAAQLYREVLDIEPDNAEARTYTAWLLALFAQSTSSTETGDLAVQQSRDSFEAVLKSNPGYADAHCLYAVANGRFYPEPDLELAKREAQACLDNNPPTEMRGLVEQFLTSLQDATTTTTG
ncbi:MAG: tetratricopeptide repeat protein [Ilumatobacteraceae bacterium]|jgi:tetratricopeptide (TPR) repeat protein